MQNFPIWRELSTTRFLIDTNRINARGKEEHMNQLEQWGKIGIIELVHSDTVMAELRSYPLGFEKGAEKLFTGSFAEDESTNDFKKIESIIFANGSRNDNQKNDVRIIFHALKYHYILVTNDGDSKSQPGGMLGHAVALKKELGVEIMRDNEAVCFVQDKIEERDEYARDYSRETGTPLPFWVGNDLIENEVN